MEKIFQFEKMEIYQKSIDFIDMVYDITSKYPDTERFGLVSQFRRCSSSVALNIAEGYGRYHKKDKIRFYNYARSSVFECIPILAISKRRRFIDNTEKIKIYSECYDLSRMITGLIKAVDARK
jgi:four helix bundle protein